MFSFADDTAIIYSGPTYHDAITKCEADLKLMNNWFIFHKICPNLSKTHWIKYAYKTTKEETLDIPWHLLGCTGKKLECTCLKIHKISEIKYLGLLNWKAYSISLQAKIRKLNFLMYYLRKKYHLI